MKIKEFFSSYLNDTAVLDPYVGDNAYAESVVNAERERDIRAFMDGR